MILINFSHPMTEAQVEVAGALVGQPIQQVIEVKVQFDTEQPFIPQAAALVDQVPLDANAWQQTPVLLVLPALNFIAALVLAEVHARTGHFPSILRLKPVTDAVMTRYEAAEIINLEQVRQQARARR